MRDPLSRVGYYVMTFTGRRWWPHDPRPEDVHVGDLAALAQVLRFGGATSYRWPEWRVGRLAPYTVAQHSCHVFELVREWLVDQSSVTRVPFIPDDGFPVCDGYMVGPDDGVSALEPIRERAKTQVLRAALLHDGHEVYPPGDQLSPVLRHACAATDAIRGMSRAAADAFRRAVQIPLTMPEIVKRADAVMLATEKRDLHMPELPEWGDNGRVLPPPRERRIDVWDPEHAREAFFRRLADVAPDLRPAA